MQINLYFLACLGVIEYRINIPMRLIMAWERNCFAEKIKPRFDFFDNFTDFYIVCIKFMAYFWSCIV